MNDILPYFYEYFKTNYFLIFLLAILFLFFLLKRVQFLSKINPGWVLALFFVLGLGLRIGWIEFSSYTPKTDWIPSHMLESDVTNVHALELTDGIWFHDAAGMPSGRRPIGYPIALGICYKIFGPYAWSAYTFNLFLFVATYFLVYFLGISLFRDYRIGLLSAAIFAIYPTSIFSIKLITDEHLFLPFFYLGLLLLALQKVHMSTKVPLWVYGLLFGYATMIRTHSIFMPLVVGLVYFLMNKSWRVVAGAVIVTMFLMQLLNLPWVIRNYKAWGVPVVYTATANFVYAQVNSTADAEGHGHIPTRGEEGYSQAIEDARLTNEGLYHMLCQKEMNRWILTHPLKFLSMGIGRVLIFMGWNRSGGVWPIWFQYYEGSYDKNRPVSPELRRLFEESAYIAYYVLFYTFFLGAALLILRRSKKWRFSQHWIIAAVFLFWLAEHMVIYPDRKYRFPLEPLMMIYASYFLVWCYDSKFFFKKTKQETTHVTTFLHFL